MIPLVPVGGIIDSRIGVLTAPNHKGVPAGIVAGMRWAADIGCIDGPAYVKRVSSDALEWLTQMEQYRQTCLFVTVPDVVGNATATLEQFDEWRERLSGWPLAFVCQDGQELLELPSGINAVFIGGSTKWKIGDGARTVVARAVSLGLHVHIGRVNWWKRYKHFAGMPGSEEFTFDGTRNRFDGTDRTIEAWLSYAARPTQLHMPLSCGDSRG